MGGNSFNASVEPVTYDLPGRSNCTGCTFSEDFSNYWTAVLYYRAGNGTFKRVEQFPNGGLALSGGITVYDIPPYDGVSNVTALKPVSFTYSPSTWEIQELEKRVRHWHIGIRTLSRCIMEEQRLLLITFSRFPYASSQPWSLVYSRVMRECNLSIGWCKVTRT